MLEKLVLHMQIPSNELQRQILQKALFLQRKTE